MIKARVVQNLHAITWDAGATSTHKSNGPCPDDTRRTMLPALMNESGEVLGRPPATHVAAVITSHGTIQSAMRAALVPTSRQTLAVGRGAAAISVMTMRHVEGRHWDEVPVAPSGVVRDLRITPRTC
jgi:hypothetical protein